ncbi:MAG: multidrug effflux MFS transporter [Burkholderiaceae bacterium]|nr:multidrug effflux MFS transporter [Burkholderiaceae bacterium]
MPQATVVFILTLLMGIQPVTTDLYLPALPAIADGFGASMAQAQLTLSALLLAFGVSQLVWGPLSDRFGRKPIMLIGLSTYALAAVGCAWAHTIELLISWRIVQGLAMGAVVMCGRALVRDLYASSEGARVMSKGLTGLGVLACLSAPIGGFVSGLWGARATLLVLAVFGAFSLLMVALQFKESIPHKNPKALAPATLLHTWWVIVKNPVFLAYSALTAATYSVLFTFLASSSFVFIKLYGFSTATYGLIMFGMSAHYIAGTILCRRLLARYGVVRAVAIAGGISLLGGSLMGVLALAGVQSYLAIMLPFYVVAVGHGIHQPCGQTGAIMPFAKAAGAASALNGFLMMLVAFATGAWLSRHFDGSVMPMVMSVWFGTTSLAVIAWTVVRKYGHH